MKFPSFRKTKVVEPVAAPVEKLPVVDWWSLHDDYVIIPKTLFHNASTEIAGVAIDAIDGVYAGLSALHVRQLKLARYMVRRRKKGGSFVPDPLINQ